MRTTDFRINNEDVKRFWKQISFDVAFAMAMDNIAIHGETKNKPAELI